MRQNAIPRFARNDKLGLLQKAMSFRAEGEESVSVSFSFRFQEAT